MVTKLNVQLAPLGFSLAVLPGEEGKAVLAGAELEDVMRTRAFLNHGSGLFPDSGIILSLSARETELVLEYNFETLLTATSFQPGTLVRALLEAGERVLQRYRKFVAESNPLHQKLLEQRETITQAGFHLVPTHFVANFETRREIKRTTLDRVDLVEVALDGEGELAATHLVCAFAKPIAFATLMKALGQGVAKA
jgi:hypothetical protein